MEDAAAKPGLLAKAAQGKILKGTQPENNGYDFFRPRDTRTKWEKFKDDIYNPREHTFLGRTRTKWGVFGLFYLVFYTGLAILCSICGAGLMYTIDYDRPTFTMESSLIGTSPGLGFRPLDYDQLPDQFSKIKFNSQNDSSVMKWNDLVDEFLDKYKNQKKLPNEGRNQTICSYGQPPAKGKVCAFDVQSLDKCAPGTNYGYRNNAPCVFIKLNKIIDWVPEFYNDTNNLPKEMPQDLQDHIKGIDASQRNAIWVSCRSENQTNTDDFTQISYFPKSRSFPGYYYPYTNHPEYLSPIVAVQFLHPKRDTVVGIECRAWAKNIHYSSKRGEKTGAVRFDLVAESSSETEKNKKNV